MTPQRGSRLERIRIDAPDPQAASRADAVSGAPDSLMLCLQAILRAYGVTVELEVLLKLHPQPIVAPAISRCESPDVGCTPANERPLHDALARHAFLVEAARRFSLELRELHPPEAIPLPPTPREFDWHFRDSYLPFIRAALERDEPVLAWMGWPAADAREWGIITSLDPGTGVCSGWTASGRQRLIAAPVQVYTVAALAGGE